MGILLQVPILSSSCTSKNFYNLSFRTEVGINTNMGIESLNRYIKKEKLKDNSNVRLEKLLNTLEEVVDDKMWKRVIALKRPNRNTYQGRAVMKAHKKAEQILHNVEKKENGCFTVKSETQNTSYSVKYKQDCISNCKVMYCQLCNICFHKYTCECIEFLIKSITCKHIHAVALHSKKYNKGEISSGNVIETKTNNNEEITNFLEERIIGVSQTVDEADEKQLVIQNAANYMNQMFNLEDNESFKGMYNV